MWEAPGPGVRSGTACICCLGGDPQELASVSRWHGTAHSGQKSCPPLSDVAQPATPTPSLLGTPCPFFHFRKVSTYTCENRQGDVQRWGGTRGRTLGETTTAKPNQTELLPPGLETLGKASDDSSLSGQAPEALACCRLVASPDEVTQTQLTPSPLLAHWLVFGWQRLLLSCHFVLKLDPH